jgi:hypothetical protein
MTDAPDMSSKPPTENSFDGVYPVLTELKKLTPNLRVLGFVLLVLTVINSLLLVVALRWLYLSSVSSQADTPAFGPWVTTASLAVSSAALCLAVLFDLWRRRGNMIYEEIGEELQMQRRRVMREANDPVDATPPLAVRLALREFHSASSMPLASGPFGRSGPALYVFLNVGCTIIVVVIGTSAVAMAMMGGV